jgi:hypothetical protein
MSSDLTLPRRAVRALLTLTAMAFLGACEGTTLPSMDGRTPDGTVTMSMVQAAFIGSGSGGTGTLTFRGRTFPFTIAGGGVGGIGGSTIQAQGEVFGLSDVSRFSGAYAQARTGFALGTVSGGQLWLQNTNGVILHLQTSRTGVMLSLGADAIIITLGQ